MRREQLADWPERLALTRKWSEVMYGTATFQPRMVVEHYTESPTQAGALEFWDHSADATWVQFIIDKDGTITQLAPLDVIAKQAYGVSPYAFGIEHVGWSDAEVLGDAAQLNSSLRLTCWLRQKFDIPVADVVGHAEVPASPNFGFTLQGWEWIEQNRYTFHMDMRHRDMKRYRVLLSNRC
jgi:N-acetylmuramoyl-L-alanine amidase